MHHASTHDLDYLTPGSPRNRWPEGSRPADRENSRKAVGSASLNPLTTVLHSTWRAQPDIATTRLASQPPFWGPFRRSPPEAARRVWNSLEIFFLNPWTEYSLPIPVSRNLEPLVSPTINVAARKGRDIIIIRQLLALDKPSTALRGRFTTPKRTCSSRISFVRLRHPHLRLLRVRPGLPGQSIRIRTNLRNARRSWLVRSAGNMVFD